MTDEHSDEGTVVLGVRLTRTDYEHLKRIAQETERTKAAVIRLALRRYIEGRAA